jgi:hypothetical protein
VNPFRTARRLDEAVLGRPETTRGFVANLLMGLHPAMAPVWVAVALACLVAVIWRLASGHAFEAVAPAMFGLVSATSAVASWKTRPPS